jgi:parvulin-like peptidyl-prolyl isomerase
LKTQLLPLLAVLSWSALAACGEPRREDAGGPTVVATVNGVSITERDVAHRIARPGMAGMAAHAPTGDGVAAVIQDELLYQRAVELGLDRAPEYRQRLDDLEAQVRTFRRQEMASRLRGWVAQQAPVSEAEAREWFERNGDLLRTRFHVQQIFYRGKHAQLAAEHAEIVGGASFEQVARRRFEGLALDGKAPWDLGELTWNQLPPAWRGIVDRLEPGQVSPVIQEGDRSWVVRLVSKRVDRSTGFAEARELIEGQLRQQKLDQAWSKLLAEVKAKASVVRPTAPPAAPERTASAR